MVINIGLLMIGKDALSDGLKSNSMGSDGNLNVCRPKCKRLHPKSTRGTVKHGVRS